MERRLAVPPRRSRSKWAPVRRDGNGSLSLLKPRLLLRLPRNGGLGAEGRPGALHSPRALLRGARRQPQPPARTLPEGPPQQNARIRRGGRFPRGQDAPDPEDPGGQECGGPELQRHPAGAGGHQWHHGLQHRPQLPLQRLGRSLLHHVADSLHRLHGAAFWGPDQAGPGLPLHLLHPPGSPAFSAHPIRGCDCPPGVQHAHCHHQQAPASSHQLPQRPHWPAVSHHNLPALRRVPGTNLHIHRGDWRSADGADVCGLPGLPQPHSGTGSLLLEGHGPSQERVTAKVAATAACPLARGSRPGEQPQR